ncbi:hypothetical protein GUJ93_ZPchr0010g10297 [Zizania palustris]|uniref:Uncharacterized protein n=1 Tax=Zizania palustris TaxID=103762 RepID=A0A8J6BN01_ZIZPA|nr:hypothetical protein GUJ93_ZPchr0010g10297 [Zizania palustris]
MRRLATERARSAAARGGPAAHGGASTRRRLSGGGRQCGPARRSARSPEGERHSVESVRGGGDSAGGAHR